MYVSQQHLPPAVTVPILILHLLFYIHQVLLGDVPLEVLAEQLRRPLQVPLVILEYHRLVGFLQVVREHVRVHQRLPALAQYVDGLLQELHLDPAHVVLLHLLHLVLDGRVQLVLKLQALHVVHVPVAIEEISLEGGTRFLLGVSRRLRFVLVVAITVVPRAAVGLPRPQTHPTKIGLAILVLADHVIAASILFNCGIAFWTLLCVGSYPIRSFRIVVAFFYPLLEQAAFDWIVPVLAARETECVAALAGHWAGVHIADLCRRKRSFIEISGLITLV